MKNEAVSAAQKQLRDKEEEEKKKNVLDLRLFEGGKSLDQMCKKW